MSCTDLQIHIHSCKMPKFYKDIYNEWFMLHSTEPVTANDVKVKHCGIIDLSLLTEAPSIMVNGIEMVLCM